MHGSAFLDGGANMARTTAAAHREIGTFDCVTSNSSGSQGWQRHTAAQGAALETRQCNPAIGRHLSVA